MKTINQNNDCGNARDVNSNNCTCDDAEYVWVARPNDCRPADMVDNADVKGAAKENSRDGARAAEYSDAAGVADNSDAEMAGGSAKEKNARVGVGVPYYTDCANAADNADGASVADNPDAKEAECSAAEERNSVDRGLDCDGERKALAGLRDKLFDELGLMFAARSDNARKLVMPIAELEEISDTDALSERFMSRLHSARCVELMKTLTKAFFDEAVAIMIIDEASAEPPADSAEQ